MTRRSKNKENESPEGIKKSSTAHYSDTGMKIKINNENQTHIASVHDGKKHPFQCDICDAYFSKKSKLAIHVSSVHERKEQELPKNSSSTTRYTDSGIKIKIKNEFCVQTHEQKTNKQTKNGNPQISGEILDILSSTTCYNDSGIKIKMKLFGI